MSLPEYTNPHQTTESKSEKRSTSRSPSSFISKRKFVAKNEVLADLIRGSSGKVLEAAKKASASEKQDIQTQTSFVMDDLKPENLPRYRRLTV